MICAPVLGIDRRKTRYSILQLATSSAAIAARPKDETLLTMHLYVTSHNNQY